VHPTSTRIASTKPPAPPTVPTTPKITSTKVTIPKSTGPTVNISDTDQLLAMLDGTTSTSAGNTASSALNRKAQLANSRHVNIAAAPAPLRPDRNGADMRGPPGSAVMRSPQ
jgi:hypothetical protein